MRQHPRVGELVFFANQWASLLLLEEFRQHGGLLAVKLFPGHFKRILVLFLLCLARRTLFADVIRLGTLEHHAAGTHFAAQSFVYIGR